MSKDQHKGGLPEGIDEALEVRIVAWLLGEASDFERAELEAMVRDNTAARAFHSEMKSLIGDARSAHGMDGPEEDDWKLSGDRRDKVMAELGEGSGRTKASSGKLVDRWPGASIKRRMQWLSMAAAVMLFGIGLWVLSNMMFAGAGGSLKEAPMITARMAPSAEFSMKRPEEKTESLGRKPSAPAQSSRLIAAAVPSSAVYLPEVPFDTDDIDIGTSASLGQGFGGSGSGGFGGVAARRNDANEDVFGDSSDKGGEVDAFAAVKPGESVDAFETRNVGANLETQIASNGALNSRGIVGQDERFRDKKVFEEGSADPFSSGSDDVATDPFAAAPDEGEDRFAGVDESHADPFAAPTPEPTPQPKAGERYSITAGNRSGDHPITREGLESDLKGRGQVAAGIPPSVTSFSVTPATPTAFEVRDFDQDGRNGRSNVEVKREKFYSNRYEAPEPPNSVGMASGERQLVTSFPVTPATPTAFETDESGFVYPTEYDPPELPNSVGVSAGSISSNSNSHSSMVTKTFEVSPDFVPTEESDGVVGDPFAVAPGGGISSRMSAKEYLASRGVPLPEGSEVNFDPRNGKMTVTAREDAMELVEVLTDTAGAKAPVEVDTKFVDVSQRNNQELGFGWMVDDKGKKADGRGSLSAVTSFPASPATPTAFEKDESALNAITRSGDANAEIVIREFIYPDEYEPLELPNQVGGKALGQIPMLGDVAVNGRLFRSDSGEGVEALSNDGSAPEGQIVDRRLMLNQIDQEWEVDEKAAVVAGSGKKQLMVGTVVDLDVSDESIAKQETRAQQARIEQHRAMKELKVIDLSKSDDYLSKEADTPEDSLIVSGGKRIDDVEYEIKGIQSQLKGLKNLGGSDLIRKVAMLGIEHQTIQQYYPKYNELLQEEQVLLESGKEENLPKLRAIQTQKNSLEGLLSEAVEDVIRELELRDRLLNMQLFEALNRGAKPEEKENYIALYDKARAEQAKLEAMRKKREEVKKEPAKKPAPQIDLDEIFLEQSAADEGVSTFSLHVNDASFKVVAALLESGQWPDAERVREEEFVNALDYGDLSPTAAERIAAKVEQAAHPFLGGRNLVRIGLRTASVGRDTRMPLHLTILLDTSGSMEREDRREIVARSLASLATMLGENDVVSLVGFSRNTRLLLDRVPGNRAGELVKTAMALPAEGGTNIEAALTLAGEIAGRQFNAGGQNRIVMLTDGAANLGGVDAERLMAMGSQFREMGVALDCYGVGIDGLDDTVLEALTRKGDGRYFVLNTPQEADVEFAKAVAGTLSPLALDVKVQVRFNPDRVGGYRLIGFRKQRLNEEDFRNDAVDGGEIAAAAEGNALYQVEVVPDGSGDIGEVWVRFRDARTSEMIEKQWRIPYDEKAKSLADAEETMKMAGVAGLFAEALLKGAEIGGEEVKELEPLARDVATRRDYDERLKEMAKAVSDAAGL